MIPLAGGMEQMNGSSPITATRIESYLRQQRTRWPHGPRFLCQKWKRFTSALYILNQRTPSKRSSRPSSSFAATATSHQCDRVHVENSFIMKNDYKLNDWFTFSVDYHQQVRRRKMEGNNFHIDISKTDALCDAINWNKIVFASGGFKYKQKEKKKKRKNFGPFFKLHTAYEDGSQSSWCCLIDSLNFSFLSVRKLTKNSEK